MAMALKELKNELNSEQLIGEYTMLVAVNDFVRRQVKNSGKTYAKTLSFDQIANHASTQMQNKIYRDGYRDGVRIVVVDESIKSDFICPFVKLNNKLLSFFFDINRLTWKSKRSIIFFNYLFNFYC